MRVFFKWVFLLLGIFMTILLFPAIVEVIPVFFDNAAYNFGQYIVYLGIPALLFFLFLVFSDKKKKI